jgi:predicted dehydrogenase
MQSVRVGVIGCGEIAQWMHLPFLTELPGFQVTAVCDISPKVAAYVGDRFGVSACPQTGWRWLRRLGFRLVVPRPRHPKAASAEAQARWL